MSNFNEAYHSRQHDYDEWKKRQPVLGVPRTQEEKRAFSEAWDARYEESLK